MVAQAGHLHIIFGVARRDQSIPCHAEMSCRWGGDAGGWLSVAVASEILIGILNTKHTLVGEWMNHTHSLIPSCLSAILHCPIVTPIITLSSLWCVVMADVKVVCVKQRCDKSRLVHNWS